MKKMLAGLVVSVVLLMTNAAWASSWNDTLAGYNCLEVEKFYVDRDDYSSKKMERAAAIPDETIASLQHKIVGEAHRKDLLPQIKKAGAAACQGKTLILGGKVTEYKKGSRAARMMLGLGAGKQKFEVQCYLKDKQSGQMLANKKVVDRKMGGISGGDEAKGEHDFAEKVAKFVKKGK